MFIYFFLSKVFFSNNKLLLKTDWNLAKVSLKTEPSFRNKILHVIWHIIAPYMELLFYLQGIGEGLLLSNCTYSTGTTKVASSRQDLYLIMYWHSTSYSQWLIIVLTDLFSSRSQCNVQNVS